MGSGCRRLLARASSCGEDGQREGERQVRLLTCGDCDPARHLRDNLRAALGGAHGFRRASSLEKGEDMRMRNAC